MRLDNASIFLETSRPWKCLIPFSTCRHIAHSLMTQPGAQHPPLEQPCTAAFNWSVSANTSVQDSWWLPVLYLECLAPSWFYKTSANTPLSFLLPQVRRGFPVFWFRKKAFINQMLFVKTGSSYTAMRVLGKYSSQHCEVAFINKNYYISIPLLRQRK